MCKWGTLIEIAIVTHVKVDACLAREVLWLNDRGVRTVSSCCGHSKHECGRPSIVIRAASAKRARELGYNPQPAGDGEGGGEAEDYMVLYYDPADPRLGMLGMLGVE